MIIYKYYILLIFLQKKKGDATMNFEPWMIWAAVIAIFLIVAIFFYNRLVFLRNKVEETFKTIDVYLEKRFDTLTKQAEVVAAYAKHERGTFSEIAQLRSQYPRMNTNEKISASNQVDSMMNRIGLQVENYPELRANPHYLFLQRTINDLEENLAASRRTFNSRVNQYNTLLQQFPTSLYAVIFRFEKREMLRIEEHKRKDIDMGTLLGG